MPKITILTSPIRWQKKSILNLQCIVPFVKHGILKIIENNKPGGHPAVTRSALRGLQKINADFNYNPWHIRDVGKSVVVLSGIDALKQAIDWRRRGIINRLLAGPNLINRADESDGILGSSEIDTCLVASDWVRIAYEEDCPVLRNRTKCWYVGVDEDYWKPANTPYTGKHVLVYWKSESEEFCQTTESSLKDYGWEPIRIIYGHYKKRAYRDILSRVKFAVFLSRSETQGIALAEAWAMDIPTLVWNPKQLNAHGRKYSTVSACPYLSSKTGIEWSDIEEFNNILHQSQNRLTNYNPRSWVLKNMTDTICAHNLVNLLWPTT